MAISALAALALIAISQDAYAHTIDSIDNKYRIEIGWMNEPVVSGEGNGIELFISPLTPCPDLDAITCASQQEFHDGITGLEKDIQIQLLYKTEKITLVMRADHNIPGAYYTFVTPAKSGFYQANLLGSIQGTPVSLSMHPPKVGDPSFIKFPEEAEHGASDHDTITNQIADLNNRLDMLQGEVTALQADLESVDDIIFEIGSSVDAVRDGDLATLQDELEAIRDSGDDQGSAIAYTAIAISLGSIGVAVAAIVSRRR